MASSENGWVLPNDEQKRLLSRYDHLAILKQAQMAKLHLGDKDKKIKQGMYLHSIGKIPDFISTSVSKNNESPEVENLIGRAKLYENVEFEGFVQKRQEFCIIEDDISKTLHKKFSSPESLTYDNLLRACAKFEDTFMLNQHKRKSQESCVHFTKIGIDEDKAKSYALAIAFYTGAYSYAINADATILARQSALMDTSQAQVNYDEDILLIMYNLICGLSYLDFHWGSVLRYVQLEDSELQDYQPGEIITWLQFSSSDKGGKNMNHFINRNTVFHIYSLTGRSIQKFSNLAEDEDEILFLPHSCFLVCNIVKDAVTKQTRIFMRQIELGLSKYVVLWVDDNILDKNWENKILMEQATKLGAGLNVHFIPKTTTSAALEFLKSPFGKRLQNSDTFRIVTDMKRTNEESPSTAGARFIRELRQLHFKQKCLVYTGKSASAAKRMKEVFGVQDVEGVNLTDDINYLERFITFRRI